MHQAVGSSGDPSAAHQQLSRMQVGVDVTGDAVQRAGRKVAAAYKQAQDPLSLPLQQLGGLAEGARKTAGASTSKQLPSAQLYHGDIATANATKPGECCNHLAWIKQSHPQKAERQLLLVICIVCSQSLEAPSVGALGS